MLTFKQTLQYLAISESTLYRLMLRGKLTGYKVGSCWRFKKDELEAYINAHRSVARASL